ncbi:MULTISPECIES: glycerol-3-phosphate dehydrogenase/oxidase [unclassified Aureimonas]|uniref:glycerol-3-phosphate dehydrogenase/oxidase n=1 Tax=unclassified Aureimonas TaxID=2615206 RepID=UPI0006F2BE4E|nr:MULTISPECIES: glycerol-3-phosphate dehydrogenase/oxidase [unclassified Aureimonas]KQT57728.1 glycerol-3-phosphate dehydrogenase [Aureimonas sp. Leaf427]KQT75797.1 glycerol-3-phosphate dehydrogenase [Aureimonas sp. Leaf460]
MNASAAFPTGSRHFDVVIIGAGINGVGTFRDLCLQGVDCLLVDRADICSGASEASSRLMHGGLKYLETGEFRLVRQSAEERNLLLRNAPHFVSPLETALPIRSWFGGIVPSIRRFFGLSARLTDRGVLITKLGLTLYDIFGRRFRAMPAHRFIGRRRARRELPGLHPAISAVGLYYEARLDHAERLGLELVEDALADHPSSEVRTYASVRRGADGGIEITDALTGETRRITVDIVVNASGAWIDGVNAALGLNSRHMGGTKGSHVVVDNPALLAALSGRMVYFGSADGRVNLLYPFKGRVLIGSTDIPVADPDTAEASQAETDYLIGVVAEVFPDIEVRRDEIVFAFCGVRPLPRADVEDPGAISRDHSIAVDKLPGTEVPVLSLIGGKWTTYRGFSEEAADRVLAHLGRTRRASTADLPIGGGRDYPCDAAARERLVGDLARTAKADGEVGERLLKRYGTRAADIASAIGASDGRRLASLPDHHVAEIGWIAANERVRTVEDILRRRTDIALSGLATPQVRAEVEAIWAEVSASAQHHTLAS